MPSMNVILQVAAVTALTMFVLNVASSTSPALRKAVTGNVVTGIAV